MTRLTQVLLIVCVGCMVDTSSGKGKGCYPNPCLNGGTCTTSKGTYTCTCVAGYTGTNCEINKNECASSPCQNGGTCIDGVNSYRCTCIPGYTGTNCQTNINECGSTPCLNGGTCTDGVNSYTCTCVLGYTGANCETATTVKPGTCPTSSGFGVCWEACTNDFNCPLNQKCCSNGCGHVCKTPV